MLLTYLHVGQLLFADKKCLLLKRITVQSWEKTLLRNIKSKRPLYCMPPLSCRRKPCKHRTTTLPIKMKPCRRHGWADKSQNNAGAREIQFNSMMYGVWHALYYLENVVNPKEWGFCIYIGRSIDALCAMQLIKNLARWYGCVTKQCLQL
jgi:hypothetical protein